MRTIHLILAMFLGCVCCSMYAQNGSCGANVTWKIDGSKLIISGSGDMQTDTKPWDAYSSTINSIEVEGSVTSICDNAFSGLKNVRLLSFNDGSTTLKLGKYAFSASEMDNVYVGRNTDILYGVGSSNTPFKYVTCIKKLVFGNDVTSISKYTFYGPMVYSLTIGTGMKEIKSSSLGKIKKTIWLPNTAPAGISYADGEINYAANEKYSSLPKVYINSYISSSFTVNGIVYCYDMKTMSCDVIDCDYLDINTNISIGKTVTYLTKTFNVKQILPYACYRNPYINTLTLENDGNVGDYAFYQCTGMTDATINNNGYVGVSAFEDDTKLNNLFVTNNGSIKDSAFKGSKTLKSVKIQNNGYIGSSAFSFTTFPSQFKIENNGDIYSRAFYTTKGFFAVDILSTGSTIRDCAFENSTVKAARIADNIKSLQVSCFQNCTSLSTFDYGTGLITIADSCFKHCSNLAILKIPNSVTKLGEYVFAECYNSKSLSIGNGIRKLPRATFYGCQSLESVSIPANVDSVIVECFDGCSSLADIRIEDKADYLCFEGVGYISVDHPAFRDCKGYNLYLGRPLCVEGVKLTPSNNKIKSYTPFYGTRVKTVRIGGKSNGVYPYAFYSCITLTDVTVDEGIAGIGNNAFQDCSGLQTIAFPNTLTLLGEYAFSGCTALKSIKWGTGLTTINKYVFANCAALPLIQIPSSVTSLLQYAFYGCVSAKSLVMDNSTSSLTIEDGVFSGCPCDSIYMGRNLGYTNSPFSGKETVRTFVADGYATRIGNKLFYQCRGLKSVLLTDKIRSIGTWAFSACMYLDELSLGSNLSSVENEAFSDCRFKNVYSYAKTPAKCGTNAFADINGQDCVLHVPAGLESAYSSADGWLNFWFIEPISETVLGDANNDNQVDVTDYVAVGNYILGNTPANFNMDAADVNTDKQINVQDYVGVANIILYENPFGQSSKQSVQALHAEEGYYAMDMWSTDGLSWKVSLDNSDAICAMQMNVELPAGMGIEAATLSSRAKKSHAVTFRQKDDNTWTVLVASMRNDGFWGNEGEVLELRLTPSQENGEIRLSDILLSDNRMNGHRVQDVVVSGVATGFATVGQNEAERDIYTLQGMKVTTNTALKPGVYVVDGRKVMIK